MAVFYFPDPGIIEINQRHLDQLKQAARQAPLRRARFCLHRDENDKVHEMVIAFCRDSYVPPHRHRNKSESFHVIEGRLLVVFFNEQGAVTGKMEMSPLAAGKTFFYRLNAEQWHTVIPLTDFVILHETTPGPFRKEESDFPAWAPAAADEAAIRKFIRQITG